MIKSDYDGIIKQLSNPDTMSEALIQLSEKLKTDEVEFNRLIESNNNLRDTNSRLALRLTNNVEPVKPEPTNEEIFNDLFTSRFTNA